MKASFFMVCFMFSSTLISIKTLQSSENQRNHVKKLEYKKALNLSNTYAVKGDFKTAYRYAKIAYNLTQSKESMYLLSRVYNYLKDYNSLLKISEEILKKDKNDYLGLKYKTVALIEKKSPDALFVAKKGYRLYKEDFKKLLNLAYELV